MGSKNVVEIQVAIDRVNSKFARAIRASRSNRRDEMSPLRGVTYVMKVILEEGVTI